MIRPIFLLLLILSLTAHGQDPADAVGAQLPKEKQTTLGLYVTSAQAYDRWKAAQDKVFIIDVRTPEEVIFVGHPAMAWNIPMFTQTLEWDCVKHHFKMAPAADFLQRVQEVAGPGDTLMVMCRSGSRSAMAVDQLAKAGYTHVYNITDGMEGDLVTDPTSTFHGQRMVNGWKNSGVPWTYHPDPTRMKLK